MDGITHVIMVTMNGSLMPAVLKKYYGRVSFDTTKHSDDHEELTVEYPKTTGAPAAHWLQIPMQPASVLRQLIPLKISR
jgi:hypothetical protein